MSSRDRASIIEYWRTIEMFSPQDIPKLSSQDLVYRLKPGMRLPWETGGPKRLPKDMMWQYKLYFGIYNLEETFKALKRACGSDPDTYEERGYNDAALGGILLNEHGRPQLKTFTLSSCAWGLGRALNVGSRTGWLDGFDLATGAAGRSLDELLFRPLAKPSESLLAELAKYVLALTGTETLEAVLEAVTQLWNPEAAAADTGTGMPIPVLTAGHLSEITSMLVRLTGTSEIFPKLEVRIKCEEIRRRDDDEEPGFDFLNSMFLDDLAAVRDEVRAGHCSSVLRTYLSEKHDDSRRIDVRKNRETVLDRVRPDSVPYGRWPENPEYGLALHQQLAVDNALIDLADGTGVIGVNGPPGTGKTTLLRDVMAALVTRRAQAMAELRQPRDAFVDLLQWKSGGFDRKVPVLAPQLTGYEMVVASTNNGAVENVTTETPDLSAINERWLDEVDYYRDIATAVLNSGKLDKPKEWKPAWGLAAAKLGKAKFRSDFVNAFWFDEKSKDGKVIRTALQTRLNNVTPTVPWSEAVAKFRSAEQKVKRLRQDRDRVRRAWLNRSEVEAQLAAAEKDAEEAAVQHEQWRAHAADQQAGLDTSTQRYRQCEADRDAHRARRPGLIELLTSLGKAMRPWREEDQELAVRSREARTIMDDHRKRADEVARHLKACEHAVAAATQLAGTKHAEKQRIDQTIDRAPGVRLPVDPDDQESFQTNTPWLDTELNEARSQLFIEALHLHRAFIEHNAKLLRQGLNSAVDAVKGKMPRDIDPEIRLAAWQHLFLVVPVVSTTFASYGRMFGNVPAESLGWLLVDEAGQAVPQAAVGAMWRSKRVMSVGDPLQLEPVVPMPPSVQQSLRVYADVTERWLPERTSVQRLADDATTMGTSLKGPNGDPLWVGTPLTVHRRCEDPMMKISNIVAYNGMMIKATPERGEFTTDHGVVPCSEWIDVASSESNGHWIPAEGVELDSMLTKLSQDGVDMKQVIMVSPFRDVAKQLEKRQSWFKTGPSGTVHTAQGKEADIVFLVLGGDPSNQRARDWAAEKPNLVNVAVSRAKRRLYVIGHKGRWSKLKHFSDVEAGLTPDGA